MVSGKDWEEEFESLVKVKYRDHPPGHYQPIPAEYLGDCGIEGFDHEGVGYQCYGPEIALKPADEYDAYRSKMTKDLKKLDKNKVTLAKLLGDVKLDRWVFGVPVFTNKDLLEHARKKEKEIRALGLSFVTSTFHIVVVCRDDFVAELAYLDSLGSELVAAHLPALPDGDVTTWIGSNDTLAKALTNKVGKIGIEESARTALELSLVRAYLRADSLKAYLRSKRFELFTRVETARKTHEAELGYAVVALGTGNLAALQSTIARQQQLLADSAGAVDSSSRVHLAHGAAADWLMRCPLDFPEAD